MTSVKATAAAPLPVGSAGPVRTVTPARAHSSALAALLALLPTDAPTGSAVREPKWIAQVAQTSITEAQQSFLRRINWTGAIACDDPETYTPEARRDVCLPSAAKLRKAKKPGGLIADAMLAAMAQKGTLSVVDCLAIYNSEGVKISSIGALLNRLGRVIGSAVTLHKDGNITAQSVGGDGFYQGSAELEKTLRGLAAESLNKMYQPEMKS